VKIQFPHCIGNVNLYGLPADIPGAVENDYDGGNIFSLAKPREDL
jgi:hypothetical protein